MINKRKWDRLNVPWLKPNQIQADPLGDLRINEGTLSVWQIEDDRANLDLVITALAATRQNFDKFEYGLFDQEIVTYLGLKVRISSGNTPIDAANDWHRDLIQLTADQALSLVKSMFDTLEKHRLYDDEVQTGILNAIQQGYLDLHKVNKSPRNKITQL
jgi:hypothetical protein